MPINGNPHPLPGVPLPELPQFILPPYPALGWNDVPPPPPPPDAQPNIGGSNWGNNGWNDEEEQHNEPVQDQESMVIDQPELSESEEQQAQQINFVIVPDEEQQVQVQNQVLEPVDD